MEQDTTPANVPRSPFLDRLGISAVIFDLDGVLIDSLPYHYLSYRQMMAEAGLPVSEMDIYLREGLGTPEVLESLSEEKGWGLTAERIGELTSRRRALYQEVYEHRVFPEVPELLTWLTEAGYRLGVVSGATKRSVDLCLNQCRIEGGGGCLGQWFSLVVSGSAVERGKPHPEPYLKALEQLGLEGRQVLVVENAPAGVNSARAAGCYVAALETTLPRAYLKGAQWILANHAALLRLLRHGIE